jgi:hypothetical protein
MSEAPKDETWRLRYLRILAGRVKEVGDSQEDLQAIEDLMDERLIRGSTVPDQEGIVRAAALVTGSDGRAVPTLKGRLFIEDQRAFLRSRTVIGRLKAIWPLLIPILISVLSLYFSGLALHRQTVQSKMELWNSLRREFDHDLKKERKACGSAFERGEIDKQYPNVMDFFETVGFLVRTERIDKDLFEKTWWYYFAGYFQATEQLLNEDRAKDKGSYADVFYLARKYKDHPALKPDSEDLCDLFEGERDLPDSTAP